MSIETHIQTSSELFEFKLNKGNQKSALDYPEKNKKLAHSKKTKFPNINFNKNNFNLFKLLFFNLILMLLPQQIILFYKHSIKIKVSSSGYQRIFSDKYKGPYPNITYINDEVTIFRNEKLDISSYNSEILMLFEKPLSDFTYMFSDSRNIISVELNNMLEGNCNMSYMFYNCYNLYEVKYISNDNPYLITDTISMFYNCISLPTFSFDDLNFGECSSSSGICSDDNYFYRNMSYMFYNCQNLRTISLANDIKYVNDMQYMFYNCILLQSIQLNKFGTNSCPDCYIDISHIFHNCKQLSNIDLNHDFYVKDIYNMFYNCESLQSINIDSFKSSASYHINMSYLFYNCLQLNTINGDFSNFFISDTRNMFYNCKSLRYKVANSDENIFIYIKNINMTLINLALNMSKMFYNCESIRKINILPGDISEYTNNKYIFPNDFNSMFYNCYSLISANLEYFRTDNVRNMSYMFYNCKNLLFFSRNEFSSNVSLLVEKRTMKGMFQNCESLISLNLTENFDTKNVEIMWDMFKGCTQLTDLILQGPDIPHVSQEAIDTTIIEELSDLQNLEAFDTSQVTDMESMFEGCTSLSFLNISKFITQKVQYMKKMFYNCHNLKSLYFHSISSNSLGTMYQMFYNCAGLEYLDIYSLTENSQSIIEMFEGVNPNLEFCIKENEDMPNIFNMLLEIPGSKRDCSINCYYEGERPKVPSKKLCCKNVKFENNCYEKCPGRTMVKNIDRECENFTCPYKEPLNYSFIYYNYEQNDCIASIPDKYFLNDSTLNTIDKCHNDCATCLKKADDDNNTNCETCDENNKPYIYLGNCYKECRYGNYTNNESKIECYCFDEKCLICPEEVAKEHLCTECNNEKKFYKKSYIHDTKFDCYKNLAEHFLRENEYYKCYDSCETCYNVSEGVNESYHYCKECNNNNPFLFNNSHIINCYPNCSDYFYFDDLAGKFTNYTCTNISKCPDTHPFLIQNIRQCVNHCGYNKFYPWEFNNRCYSKCPIDTVPDEKRDFNCLLYCPFERPFKNVTAMTCVSNCTIEERRDKKCVTHYNGTRSNLEIQDKIVEDIENHLTSRTFDYLMIDNESIILEENKTTYELTIMGANRPSPLSSSLNLDECEKALRGYYSIPQNESIYLLKFDIYLPGKLGPTVEYKAYYPLDNPTRNPDFPIKLDPLDLTICEGKPMTISYIRNLSEDEYFYDKNSPYYTDLCAPYDSDIGYDITIDDRKNQYIEGNSSLCEENCKFDGYEKEISQVNCACEIKFNFPMITEITIDKDKLYKFMDLKMIANFNVMKCYNLIIDIKRLKINYGFYLFIPAFIMYFVCLIIFYLRDIKLIKKQLDDIISVKNFLKSLLDNANKGPSNNNHKSKYEPCGYTVVKKIKRLTGIFEANKQKRASIDIVKNLPNQIKDLLNIKSVNNPLNIFQNKDNNISNNKIKENVQPNNISPLPKRNSCQIMNPKKYQEKTSNLITSNFPYSKNNLTNDKSKIQLNNNINISQNSKLNSLITPEQQKRIAEIMKLNDSEMNSLTYIKALKYDNRTYIQFYYSLLKTGHIVIKIFNKTDYNSQIIKLFLSVFNFCMNLAVNALFFSDDTMHRILEDEGEFNFIYQLPQIIYSTVICFIFEFILDYFALSEDSILNIKNEKKLGNITRLAKNLWRDLQIKFVYFFILSFVFLMVFWYYVACFCAVYKNTQFHLIKDSLIGFGTGLLTPAAIALLPGFFRIPAIKKRKEFMFLFSKILQLFS